MNSQSTTDIFGNKSQLKNIKSTGTKLFLKTNGGTLVTNKKGHLPGYGEVWYHQKAITNILSLNNVKKTHKITYNSANQDKFVVTKPGTKLEFKPSKEGLYYCKLQEWSTEKLNTVQELKGHFPEKKYERAKVAKKLHQAREHPSRQEYKAGQPFPSGRME